MQIKTLLNSVVIKPNKDGMRDVYGEGVSAKEVLQENKLTGARRTAGFPQYVGPLLGAHG